MHDSRIKTGTFYMKTSDGDIFKVGTAGELNVTYDDNEYTDEVNLGLNEEVSLSLSGSIKIDKRNRLFEKRVWYRKRKGKRYILTYRYENIFDNEIKKYKRIFKTIKKMSKRFKKVECEIQRRFYEACLKSEEEERRILDKKDNNWNEYVNKNAEETIYHLNEDIKEFKERCNDETN